MRISTGWAPPGLAGAWAAGACGAGALAAGWAGAAGFAGAAAGGCEQAARLRTARIASTGRGRGGFEREPHGISSPLAGNPRTGGPWGVAPASARERSRLGLGGRAGGVSVRRGGLLLDGALARQLVLEEASHADHAHVGL